MKDGFPLSFIEFVPLDSEAEYKPVEGNGVQSTPLRPPKKLSLIQDDFYSFFVAHRCSFKGPLTNRNWPAAVSFRINCVATSCLAFFLNRV